MTNYVFRSSEDNSVVLTAHHGCFFTWGYLLEGEDSVSDCYVNSNRFVSEQHKTNITLHISCYHDNKRKLHMYKIFTL